MDGKLVDHTELDEIRFARFHFISGNDVKVTVKYSDRSPKFEGRYTLDQTIYDVIADMLKNTKKEVDHIRNSKSEEALDEDTSLATLRNDGQLYKLTAVLSKKKSDSR